MKPTLTLNRTMLNPDNLRQEIAATLLSYGTTTNVRFGCPNPDSSAWKLGVEFIHPQGAGVVSVWQSGDCDIDFLAEGSRDGIALHGEFDSNSELLQFVTSSIPALLTQK